MLSKTFATLALAASLVSAQTHTDCNPLKTTCPADPAFGKNSASCDLTQGLCSAFHTLPGTTVTKDSKGTLFQIQKLGNAPTVRTDKYIFFGRVDIEVQAAKGKGIVTSAVLQSDDLDEIDWEWVGGDDAQVQSNYFSKGDDSTFTRGAFHPVSTPLDTFHTYSLEWTAAAVNWIIDGKVVRTLKASDVGSAFPQTPMQIKLGTWIGGGPDSPEGTAQWAGGRTDFSQAPFNAWYKSIKIVDYAGGNGPTSKSVKEYVYGDKTGSASSIKLVAGDGSSSGGDDNSSSSSAAASTSSKATSTKSEPKSTSTKEASTKETETKTTTTKAAETTLTTASQTGSGSSNATATTATGTGAATGSSTAQPTTSKVPESAAIRNVGSILAAGAGLFLAQLVL